MLTRRKMLAACAAVPAVVVAPAFGDAKPASEVAKGIASLVPDSVDSIALLTVVGVTDTPGSEHYLCTRCSLHTQGLPGPARPDWLQWDPELRAFAIGNGHFVTPGALLDAVTVLEVR